MASPGSLGIGKIYGIPIELNWIFVIMILFLLYVDLFTGILFILLFVCVLIHELSHSVTAVRNHIRVSRIILLPIGGVSVIDSVRIDPKVEFNISIAGPVMSLFLGGVFGVIAVILPPGIIEQIVNTLFALNIFLGLFNIIPAFPMDGGRIFRSYLQRRRSLFDATMLTAKISRIVLGIIVIATLAFAAFYTSYPLYGRVYDLVITLIIAMFLYGGIKAEETSMVISRETAGMKIGQFASRHFAYIKPNASIRQLYEKIKASGEHTVLTSASGNCMVVNLGKTKNSEASTVSQIATPIPVFDARMPVSEALVRLSSAEIGMAAVKKRGKLSGIVTYPHLQSVIALHMAGKKGRKV
ncbi:MAG: site-2 protease family protein [Candidatus Micrarchaeaceae archaeon]